MTLTLFWSLLSVLGSIVIDGGVMAKCEAVGGSCIPKIAFRSLRTTTAICSSTTKRSSSAPLETLFHSEIQNPIWVRGGGEIELPSEEESFVVLKVRNLVRTFFQFCDKNVPVVSKLFRPLIQSLEQVMGVRLLPSPDKKGKKKQKAGKSNIKSSKSKRKKTKKEEEKGEEEKEQPSQKQEQDNAEESESSEKKKTKKSSKATKSSTTPKPSAATKKHLASNIKSNNPNYRIQRELKEFLSSPPPNLSVKVGSNIRVWIITMVGAEKTIYEGEVFKLRVSFPPQYPVVPPSVYFLQGHMPIHEHVYTNGDICLSLLGKDWRPTMTAQSIAVSILSILSSAQSKSLPMDNARHATNKPGQYQKDWVYHDDNC